jgi:hypothetical protein
VSAAMLAANPLAMDMPAGSSAPELILNPVDNCVNVFCRDVCVDESAFSATRLETLFSTLIIEIAPCIEFRLHRTSPFIAKSGTATWSRWFLLRAIYRRLVARIPVGRGKDIAHIKSFVLSTFTTFVLCMLATLDHPPKKQSDVNCNHSGGGIENRFARGPHPSQHN